MAPCVLDSCSCVLVIVSLTRAALFTGTTHTCLPGRCKLPCMRIYAGLHEGTYSRMHAHTRACIHARMPPAVSSRHQCIRLHVYPELGGGAGLVRTK